MLGARLLSLSLHGSHSSAVAPFCRTTGSSTEACAFSRERCTRLSLPSEGSMYLQKAKYRSNEWYLKSPQLWEALLLWAGATALGGLPGEDIEAGDAVSCSQRCWSQCSKYKTNLSEVRSYTVRLGRRAGVICLWDLRSYCSPFHVCFFLSLKTTNGQEKNAFWYANWGCCIIP